MAIERFPTEDEFSKWIANGLNVYLQGLHGVGKTEMALAACVKDGLKFKYFSVPTLDPWVNFVGIPREGKDEKGRPAIDFLLPREMSDDLEVVILDEYPRAKPAIRNAVMELIQFKSINGRKFSKLKSIIACANPHDDDGTYDGERIDPAQLDRFHIHVSVPYEMNLEWCIKKYGKSAEAIIQWWSGLSPAIRASVSPRRVAQAYDACKAGIDPETMLPYQANLAAFEQICLEGEAESSLTRTVRRVASMALTENSAAHLLREKDLQDLVMAQEDQLKAALTPLKKEERAVVFAHMPSATLERLAISINKSKSWFVSWFTSSAQTVPQSIMLGCMRHESLNKVLQLALKSTAALSDPKLGRVLKRLDKKLQISLEDLESGVVEVGFGDTGATSWDSTF